MTTDPHLESLNKTLAQNLVSKKLISMEQMKEALDACAKGEARYIGQYLISKQWVDPAVIAREIQSSSSGQQTQKSAITSSVLQEGGQFGGYQILNEIARGGMGVVYRAQELTSKRIVALKVLLKGDSAGGEEIKRFFREAQAASTLNHPNIVKIYSMGEEGGYHFFTMDYVEGTDFKDFLAQNPPLRTLIKKIAQISRALYTAHQQKIIHRDIKPANILIDKQGNPYLTDFGLVKSLDSSTLTQSGTVLGTPFFMAPEQVSGRGKVSHQTDIYALGVMIYQCLAGRLPFEAKTLVTLYKQILEDEPTSIKKINPKVPVQLEAICFKAMEKNCKDRYQDALSLARDLEKFLAHKKNISASKKTSKKKIKWFSYAIILLLLLLGGIGWHIHQNKQKEKKQALGFLLQAEQNLSHKKWQQAISFYQKALTLSPSSTAYLGQAKAFIGLEKWQQAEKELTKAQTIAKSFEVHFQLARLYFYQREYEKSQQYIEKVIAINSQYAPVYGLRYYLLQKKGDFRNISLALTQAQKAQKLSSADLLKRANYLVSEKKWTLALAILQKLEENYTVLAEVFKLQSEIYFHHKKWPEAQAAISRAINFKQDSFFYLKRAEISLAAGYNSEIARDLKRAQKVTGTQRTHWKKIKGKFLLYQSDYIGAYEIYRSLLATEKSAELLLNIGRSSYALEKYGEALDYFSEALTANPTKKITLKIKMHQGIVYYLIKKYSLALKNLIWVKNISKAPEVLIYLGATYIALNKPDKAYPLLKKVSQKTSSNPLLYESLGKFYLKRKLYAKALENFSICMQMAPWESRYHHLYGLALWRLGKLNAAQKSLKKALELNPSSLEPFMPLLSCQFSEGLVEKMLNVAGTFNIYLIYFSMVGEPEDLFANQYNALNRRYRFLKVQKKKKAKHQKFLKLLENSSSLAIKQTAIAALVAHYDNDALFAILQKRSQSANLWKDLFKKIKQKRQSVAKEKIRRLAVRLIVGKDVDVLKELDKNATAEKILIQILNSSEEESLMRFIVCRALLTLGTPGAYQAVLGSIRQSQNFATSLLCTIALKMHKFPIRVFEESIITKGLLVQDPFLRALSLQHVTVLPSPKRFLYDSDERVRIYAAQRFAHKKGPWQKISQQILQQGVASKNPAVRIYSCAKLWPKRLPQQANTSFDTSYGFISKFHRTLLRGIKDIHPKMRKVAASRMGSYLIASDLPHLLRLLSRSEEEMVRFQALTSISWIKFDHKIFNKMAFDENESLLLRSSIIPALSKNKKDLSLATKVKSFLKEKNPLAAMFTICFMGALGGQFGPVLISPYLKNKREEIRLVTTAGLIYNGTPLYIPKLNKLLKSKSKSMRRAAAATLAAIYGRNNLKKAKHFHHRMKKSNANIRAGAAFGYYLEILDKLSESILFSQIDTNIIERYDPLRYGDIENFIYENYYVNGFRHAVTLYDVKSLFRWYLDHAIELFPTGRYLFERSLIFQADKNHKRAIMDLKQSIKLASKTQLYYLELARVYFKTRQYQKIVTTTNALLKINPRNALAWDYQGRALKALRKPFKFAFTRAYILDPTKEKRKFFPELHPYLATVKDVVKRRLFLVFMKRSSK